jgi:hypothetical protein
MHPKEKTSARNLMLVSKRVHVHIQVKHKGGENMRQYFTNAAAIIEQMASQR